MASLFNMLLLKSTAEIKPAFLASIKSWFWHRDKFMKNITEPVCLILQTGYSDGNMLVMPTLH